MGQNPTVKEKRVIMSDTFDALVPMLMFCRKEYIMKNLANQYAVCEIDVHYIELVLRKHPFWTDAQVIEEARRLRHLIDDFPKKSPETEVLKLEGYYDILQSLE